MPLGFSHLWLKDTRARVLCEVCVNAGSVCIVSAFSCRQV